MIDVVRAVADDDYRAQLGAGARVTVGIDEESSHVSTESIEIELVLIALATTERDCFDVDLDDRTLAERAAAIERGLRARHDDLVVLSDAVRAIGVIGDGTLTRPRMKDSAGLRALAEVTSETEPRELSPAVLNALRMAPPEGLWMLMLAVEPVAHERPRHRSGDRLVPAHDHALDHAALRQGPRGPPPPGASGAVPHRDRAPAGHLAAGPQHARSTDARPVRRARDGAVRASRRAAAAEGDR